MSLRADSDITIIPVTSSEVILTDVRSRNPRRSNPNTQNRKSLSGKQLTKSPFPMSGYCQGGVAPWCLLVASNDKDLRELIVAWQALTDGQKLRIKAIIEQ